MRRGTRIRGEWLALLAAAFGCNGILGIESDYHLVDSAEGGEGDGATAGTTSDGGSSMGGSTGGATIGGASGSSGVSGSSMGNGGSSARGGTGAMVGGTSGDAGESGSAGDGGTGGGTGGDGGSSATGGSSGGATGGTSQGGDGGTSGNPPPIFVQLDVVKQTIEGFGISNNWSPLTSKTALDRLFDISSDGIGLSILRVGISPNGGPLNEYSFSSGDPGLCSGHDCWEDVEQAELRGVDTFIASPWSAPASCKTNNSLKGGGSLLPGSCYSSWAQTLANFADLFADSTGGIQLSGMSLQHEPDFADCDMDRPCPAYPSMVFTSAEMVSFVKTFAQVLAGPNAPSYTFQLIAPEVAEWIHLWSNDSATGSFDPLEGDLDEYDYGHALVADPEAWGLLDALAVHQYYDQKATVLPGDVPNPKPVWMTEMSGIEHWPHGAPDGSIDNGIVVAGWIHDALVNGEASAWLWRQYAPRADDNSGLVLQGAGIDDPPTKRFFALGNYSKFIRPGYHRVETMSPASLALQVPSSAYADDDGNIVVVVINTTDAPVEVNISLSGGAAPAFLTPWVTSADDNLVAHGQVQPNGSTYRVTLDAKSVTSFVGVP